AVQPFGLSIELLDELADVHTMLSERGTDRRGGRRGTTRSLKLDLDEYFFSHDRILNVGWALPTSDIRLRSWWAEPTLPSHCGLRISECGFNETRQLRDFNPQFAFRNSQSDFFKLPVFDIHR